MNFEQNLLANIIRPKSRVLDVGSGDGSLISYLSQKRHCDARGLELDMKLVTQSIAYGLPVVQGDADHDLIHYPDDAFDYVVLQKTLQMVDRPREVLHQMLRIGRHAIVSLPNFGYWLLRLQFLIRGRMPMTTAWDIPWYATPNTHPCTILDFFALCQQEGYKIEKWVAVDGHEKEHFFFRFPHLANFFAQQAFFLLKRH